MIKVSSSALAMVMLLAGIMGASAQDQNAPASKKGEVRFAIGGTYASGMLDVGDYIEEMYAANGIAADVFVLPFGVSIVGGYRFAFGLELLADVGPVSFIFIDDPYSGDTLTNIDVPVGVTAGYAFMTDKSVSPYVRGGLRHHFSGGDFTESASPGLYVAGGINFFSNKAVQLQLEIAYDGSTVTYKEPDYLGGGMWEEIEPGAFMVSVRAAF